MPCDKGGYSGKKMGASGAKAMGPMKMPIKPASGKSKPKMIKGSSMKAPAPRPASKGKMNARKRG